MVAVVEGMIMHAEGRVSFALVVFFIRIAFAENPSENTRETANKIQTNPNLQRNQHQKTNESEKDVSSSFIYTALVGVLVCLIFLCVFSVGVYCRRLRRKRFSNERQVVYQVKDRLKSNWSGSSPPSMSNIDEHLNANAEVYHYHQAKRNIKDFLKKNPPPIPLSRLFQSKDGATPLLLTDGETSDGDMSMYGYPGLAAGNEEPTEIHNPLFDDMTDSQQEKINITLQAQVIRQYGHTDLTAYGSISRTLPSYKD